MYSIWGPHQRASSYVAVLRGSDPPPQVYTYETYLDVIRRHPAVLPPLVLFGSVHTFVDNLDHKSLIVERGCNALLDVAANRKDVKCLTIPSTELVVPIEGAAQAALNNVLGTDLKAYETQLPLHESTPYMAERILDLEV